MRHLAKCIYFIAPSECQLFCSDHVLSSSVHLELNRYSQNEFYLLTFKSFFISCNITSKTNLKKQAENFSCEGQFQDSLQDTAQFAGTKEDALHLAVLLSRTKFTSTPSLHALVAGITDCLRAQKVKPSTGINIITGIIIVDCLQAQGKQ